jgi:hypothetical protein
MIDYLKRVYYFAKRIAKLITELDTGGQKEKTKSSTSSIMK